MITSCVKESSVFVQAVGKKNNSHLYKVQKTMYKHDNFCYNENCHNKYRKDIP